MNIILKRTLHYLALFIAIIIVFLAALIGAVSIFLARSNLDVNFYQHLASDALDYPVHIERVHTTWSGINPVFVFDNIQVLDTKSQQALIKIQQVKISFSLLTSLVYWRATPHVVSITGTQLAIGQDKAGVVYINDIKPTLNFFSKLNQSMGGRTLVNRIGMPERINLQNVNLLWRDATGRTLPFQHLSIKLQHMGDLLHVVVDADLKQEIPTHLSIITNIQGAQADINVLDANVYLDIKNLVVKQWLPQKIEDSLHISDGLFTGQVWLRWRHGQFQSVQSTFQVLDLGINSPLLVSKYLLVDEMSANLLWESTDKGWVLTGDKVHWLMDEKEWPENQFRYTYVMPDASHRGSESIQMNILPLRTVSELLQKTTLLDKSTQQLLVQLKPQGQFLNAYFQRDISNLPVAQTKELDFSVQTKFQDLIVEPWKNWPGVTHLSGYFSVTSTGGQIALDAQNAEIAMPTIFLQPLDAQNLTGLIQWTHSESGWEITSDSVKWQNPVIDLETAFHIELPPSGSPSVHVIAGFNMQDAQELMNYLPARIMKSSSQGWLRQAFLHDGEITGNLLLQGNLSDFPFDNHQGIFLVSGQVKKISLHFAKDWPVVSNINAALTFENAGMYITASGADVSGTQLQAAEADIIDLRHPELMITALVNGELAQGLNYIQISPLKKTLGKQLPEIQAQGPMTVNLQLDIPLHPDEIVVKVRGDLALQNNNVVLPEWRLTFENLNGDLHFTDESVAAKLTAVLFNQPVTINIQTLQPAKDTHIVELTTSAVLATTEIEDYFKVSLAPYVQGVANVQAQLRVKHSGTQQSSVLTLSSDLHGMSLDLPTPLNKSVNEKVPFSLDLTEQKEGVKAVKIWLKYGERLSAALAYNVGSQNKQLNRGEIHFGKGDAAIPVVAGLTITGYLSQFTLDTWKTWYERWSKTTKATASESSLHNLINHVDFTFGKLVAFGQTLTQARIELWPTNEAWNLAIHSNYIEGKLAFPIKGGRELVAANFKRLYLAPVDTHSKKPLNPSLIPALNFVADDFIYVGKSYGAVNLRLSPLKNGVAIDQLKIKLPMAILSAVGEWTVSNGRQLSHLQGSVTSKDWGALLKSWDMTSSMEHGAGKTSFELFWPGAPYAGKLAIMQGAMSIDLRHGNIVNLSSQAEAEIGLGRVLNLFSLQSIARRLTFNFSDLTQKGFSYDTLRASFKLNGGIVSTRAATLEGSVAKVVLQGQLDLVRKTYDLLLIVTPHLTSSIPVIATVAGGFNPLVGAVAWVAEKVVTAPMNKITSNSYRVTGSWTNPNVVKLNTQGQSN